MGQNTYKLWVLFAFLFVVNALQGQCVGNSGFAISSPLCVGQSISFIDTTSAAKDSVIFRFSSNNVSIINDTATRTYNAATTDTVWMYRFFSAPACSDTVFQLITITQVSAAFTPSSTQNICIGDSVVFSATTAGLNYQWQESNVDIGGATNSTLTVNSTGTYRLVVSQNGCADTSSAVAVNVYNYPTADFTFATDSACSGSIVSYSNTSTGSSLSYAWSFGDGNNSTATNPTNVYDIVGTRAIVSYTASLIASTPGGCADTITKTIYVRRRPDPSIDDFNNLPKFVQCNVSSNPFSLQIDNVSTTTGTNSTYSIDWGDGTSQNFTSSFDTITHVYGTDGQFIMTVTATDSFGCTNNNTYTVFNGGNPAVSIGNTGSTSGCTPYNITFTIDTSSTGVGNNASGTTYTLNFNDGSTSPTYTHPPPPAIVKSFLVPSCGTNTPGFPNSFQAELIVTNPCGTNSATIRPIYISTKPVAEIEFDPDDDTVCLNAPFLIRDVSDTGSVSSNSGCNQTPRRLWDITPAAGWTLNSGNFGNSGNWNNNPANWGSQTLGVTFTDTGVYEVELIVGNIAQAGLSVCGDDTIRRIVRVISPPMAAFTINGAGESGCLNHVVSFTNNSTGTDLEYVWQVTPNSGYSLLSGTLTSDSPVFEFNTAGYYFIQLLAENRCSADSVQDTILVKDAPLVSLPDTQRYCGAQTIFFDTVGSVPLHRPVYENMFGDTLSYQWVITGATGYSYTSGDSTEASPTISFNQAGTYVVTVTFTNECGFDTARQIIIIDPYPVAGFTTNDTTQCLNGNSFVFTDGTTVSSGTITNYFWQFGDGDTSTTQSPTHTYSSANTYTVRLIVATENGCIDTVEHTVYVFPEPNAVFTVNDTTQCLSSNSFVFTNTSTIGSGTISYLWSFSSTANDTSTQTNPTKVYTDTGVYTVTLITTSDNGCIDTATQNVYVYPQPEPIFTINDTTQCLNGNSFVFTNTSTISTGTLGYSWNFGDGTTSTQTNPTKTYTIAGTYTVTLTTTSNNGCIDSAKGTVYIYPTPDMAFTVNDTDQCLLGNNFIFTNTSSISSGTATYLWQLSSSASDTTSTANPTRSYGAAGVYPVKLIGTSNEGCIDSITRNMTVYADPTADFSINDTAQCLSGNSFVFTNNSTAAGTLSNVWDFDDGTTSTQSSPTKTYLTPGTYTVKLVTTITSGGCKDSISKTVYVYPSPVPSFTTNSAVQCFPSHTVSLTNNSTISAGTVTYLWKFDAPSTTDTSTQTSPTKVYGTDGTYIIRLIATSNQSCIDSVQQTVTINPDISNNTIASNQGICAGFAPDSLKQTGITINGGSGTFVYQWQNSTDSISWSNIGGATSAAYQPPILTDTTWYRRIVVSGPCSDTSSPVKITVTPALADNGITANQFLCEGFTPSQFNGTSPTGGIGTFTYRWQISVDSSNWSNIGGATDTFYQSGALTQTTFFRRVVTSGVCDNNSSPVKVLVNPNPDAAFTTASVCFGLNASFTSTSTIGSGSIAQYSWTFGDGNNGIGSSTTHSYGAVGNYTIKLVTTSDSSCVDSTTRNIDIHPKPNASFTVNDTCVNNGHSFDATASTVATGAITQYNWTFGDATTGLGSTLTKTYATSGNYNPQLIIVTDSGCRDTAVVPVTVYPKPNPSFTVNDIDQCINGNSFAFTNTSTISAGTLTYAWNLGESTTDTSTQTDPSKVYAANGNYGVKLIATSNQGCVDSSTQTMIVYAKPDPIFSINDSDQCLLGNSFTFTNTSTINPLVGLSYLWRFGDGNTSTSNSPTKNYSVEGTYPVRLVVTSVNNCLDSVERNVYVRPEPTANFTINDTLQCFGPNVFTFTNTSTISSGTNTYFWRFDLLTANDTSNQTSPSKTYTGDGVYNVRLIATSDYQCKDSIQKQVEVKPDIVNNTISTDQYLCEGEIPDTLRQTATVSGGNSSFTYQWQQSTDSLNWSNIGSATDTIYIPPALTDTTWYRRIVGSEPCADTSNIVRIAVTPALANNTISASQNICFGQTPNALAGATPTGGSGTFSYLWQQSNDSTTWVSATGTNTSINYTPSSLTDTVYYRRRVISATCTTYSNIVKIAVKPLPVVNFGAITVCFPNTTTFSDSSTASAGNTITDWLWNFGDGTTSTSQNPTKVYGTAGSFSVKLIVTTDFGCQDSLSQSITVHPKPTAAFTAPNSCLGLTTNFTNTSSVSTGSIISHYWDFDDGDTTATQNPSHQFATLGTYNVTLIVTTNNGCADTLVVPVTIHPNPVANFSVNDSDQCVNSNSFVFTNSSTVPSSSNSNLWDFGSSINDTSTIANPTKVYSANGNFTVTLITTTNFGCSDTVTKPMVVYAKPTPNFSINDSDQCLRGNSFRFTNTSTISPAVGLSYMWTLGQGVSSTQTSPTKVYTADGTYAVRLVVTSIHGCLDSVEKTVYVYPDPVADFTIDDTLQCFGANVFGFTNNSTISSGSNTYFWRFDLFSANDTSTQINPTKTYTNDGTFTIRLTATSDHICRDSIEKQVVINPDILNNVISASQTLCEGTTPTTINQLSGGVSGGTSTFTYQWQSSTDSSTWTNISGATSASYAPPAPSGTSWYRRIVISGPCADTSSPVRIAIIPAIANNTITANQNICFGQTPNALNGSTPTGGNGSYNYLWQQSNNNSTWVSASGTNNTVNYTPPNLTDTVYYRRRVISATCTTFSAVVKIAVKPLPAVDWGNSTVCNPESTQFADSTTVNQGTLSTWAWAFGDGTSSSQQNPSKLYSTAGTYTVKLIVTTNFGCRDSLSQSITVHPKPVASFTNTITCAGITSNFTNTSTVATGSILSYRWSFGDGDTSIAINPTHDYATGGTYSVRLIVVSDNGCSDTITQNQTIYPNPTVAFNINDSDQCVNGNNFIFTNNSTVSSGTNTYLWNFGSSVNDTSTQATPPNKVYAFNGTFTVRLTATTNFGCSRSLDKQVVVYAKPTPAYTANDTDQCINGNSFVFSNTSTVNPFVALSYLWTFGDGTTSTQTSPTKTYSAVGTYPVKVRVTSVHGCADSTQANVYVYAKPNPAFTIDDTLQCFGPNAFTFTNGSTISTGSLSYFWRFDLNSAFDTSSQINPTKTYTGDGIYTIRLTATSDNNCKDSIEKQVEVNPDIINNAISASQAICEGATPDTLRQSGSAVSGGSSVFAYVWQQSADSISWTSIGGATSVHYAPPALTDTTWYRRIVFSGPCGDTSTPIRVAVTPSIVNNTVSSPQVICYAQTPAQLIGAAPNGGNSNFSYVWQQSNDSTTWVGASNSNTAINYQPPSLTDTVYYRRRVISAACSTFSNILKIAVEPLPVVNYGNTTECFPNATIFTDSSTVNQGTNTNWNWTFGDGTTSAQQNPRKLYAAGSYTAKLIVTTNFGCQDSVSKTITITPKPQAAFTVGDTCFGFTSNFTNNSSVSTGSIQTYNWSFGDASTSTNQTPTHTYAASGTYNVRLIVTTNNSCGDTLTKPVIIYPKPIAVFSVNDSDQCVNGNSFAFTNSSTISSGTNTYRWNFGESANDTSIVSTPPNKVYAANGNYTVTLLATSNFGCLDTADKPMVVYAKPTPLYSVNDTDQCINGNSFVFTNNSSINPSQGLSYLWNFGNGDTSTQTSPTKVYTAHGTYTVRVVVTSINGCKDSVQRPIYVYPKPTPDFAINDSLQCYGENVFGFTNNSSIASGTNTYLWRYNTLVASDTSTQTTPPAKTYATAGVYTVRLTATSDHNCKDSIEKQLEVKPDIINNAISANQFICEGSTPAPFTQTSGNVSGGSNTFVYQWQQSTDSINWSNIGAANSVGYSPVALTVTTWYRRIVFSNPCSDTSSPVKVNVTPAITQDSIQSPQVICYAQTPAQLTSVATGGGSGTFSYLWQQSNDNSTWVSAIGTNNTQNYQPTSLTDTTYYRRRVISASCTTFRNVVKIAVKPLPVVNYGNTTECFPNATIFTDSSTVNQGTNTNWNWTFGDGTTSAQQNPSKQYTAGSYTAKLIVTTNFGCQDSVSKTITITPKPQAAFTVGDTCFGFTSNFTNTSSVSTGSIQSHNWSFGDASTSTNQTPTHTYAASGTYNVRLIVTTNNSCGDTLTKPVIIYPKPIAVFSVNDSDQCVNGNSFAFTNNSTISSGTNTYRWNFGESANDTSIVSTPPNKVYAANGNYTVTLLATSNFGCLDTADKPMVVYSKPTPTFAVNDTDQCINGNSFVFTNNSSINPSQGLSYLWNFGNGDTSTQTSPTKVYTAHGTYTVRVVVTSINGCKDSVQRPIYVYPKPTPDFSINDSLQCYGENVFGFTNNSSIASGTNTYLWRYNTLVASDTSTQTTPPVKTYATAGVYTVRLTATSDHNCKDSIEKQLEVKPDIINNAISANQFICEGSTPAPFTQTSGNVSGGSSTFTYQWQQSTDSINWSNIGAANSIGYSPAALTVTTWYRRIVFSNPCSDTSSPVKVNVTPAITQDSIQSPQVICYAQTPAQLTSVATGGGSGTFSYLWQQSNDNSTWVSATGTNNAQNYQPTSLTDTTYYRRRVVSASCTTFRNVLKIAVKPLPVVNYGNTTECFPNATIFTDSSTVNQGTNTNWNWTFGDGTTSTAQNPSKLYTAGSYTVKLIVTTNFGCVDSVSKTIIVHPKPLAGYTSQDICFGFTSSFTDTSSVSTGNVIARNWDFGDGFTATAQNPNHSYNTYGTFNVRLIVTTDRNCRDTITRSVVIYPKPQAKFGVPPTCLVDSASFFDSSTVATGNINTWTWMFGDGGSSAIQNPIHSYATDGAYTAKLIVVSDRGCSDSTTNPVIIRPMPVVSFNGDTIECINRNIFYTNTSTGAFTYHWNYGDGDTSNSVVGVNSFTTPGFYRVSLIGRTVYGCIDSFARNIEIVAPPSPTFTLIPDSGCAPLQANFTNNSTDAYTSYQWNFGNGQSSNAYNPPQVTYQQSYVVDTNYVVTLRATNLCGSAFAYDTVKVYPQPVANFGPDATSGCTPKTFTFTNTSAGFPEDYFWDFGNGNTSTLQNPPPQTYTTDTVITVYTIRLRVVNRCGVDTATRTVTVLPKNAQSLFGLDTTIGCVPLTINISDFSKGATLVSYDFGDGNSSSNANPTHTFTDTGVFRIRQFISNTCTYDTSEQFIRVQPGPTVSFTNSPSTKCEGQDVNFLSQTTNVSGFRWDFGTGDTSSLSNPSYAYPAAGAYLVRLVVTSAINSCTNSYQDTVRINAAPLPVLNLDTSQGCPPLPVTFSNGSANTVFLQWKFGDGNTSNLVNPTHTYANTGVYIARLIVRNAQGCEDSIDRTIQVHPSPTADFTQTSTYCNAPVIVDFTNNSIGATGFTWAFGNGVTSSLNNPSVQFNNFGNFTTVLTASNQFGCQDTASRTFEIFQIPVPDFTLDTNRGCPPLTVSFNDNSQQANSYEWDFGDGSTDTNQSPTHTYTTSGTFSVKLKVTSGGTCADSLILGTGVVVHPVPVAGFNYSFDTRPAGYGIANFVDASQNAATYLWDFGDGGNDNIPSPTHKYSYVGNYLVTQYITTAEGCRDTAFATVEVPIFKGVFVPNAFTPGAGGPDVRTFKPVAISLKDYKFEVYDTWGKLLFSSTAIQDTKPAEGWDGVFDGKPCQQDVYVWKIEAEFLDGSIWPGQKAPNGKHYREGTVTLIR